MSQYTLKIISPIEGKGLGREYKASETIIDESNYIEIGLTVQDGSMKFEKKMTVEVVATDQTQNKTMAGTGNITPIYIDGVKTKVPYYPFHYAFKTAGKHTITFLAGGGTESVELEVK